jgi:hypothetical protein
MAIKKQKNRPPVQAMKFFLQKSELRIYCNIVLPFRVPWIVTYTPLLCLNFQFNLCLNLIPHWKINSASENYFCQLND